MKTIAFDLDGVLVKWDQSFRKLLCQNGATVPEFDEPAFYGWPEALATLDQREASWEHIRANPDWWAALPLHKDVTPQTIELIREVHNQNNVYFVTSRPKNSRPATTRWLRENLGIAEPGVIVVPKSERKHEVLSAMRFDVVVEDRIETLRDTRELAKQHKQPVPKLFLVSRPYNADGLGVLGRRKGLIVVPSTHDAVERIYNGS